PDSFYRYEAYLMGVAFYDHSLKQLPLPQVVDGEKKLAEALKMPEGKQRTDEIQKVEEKYFRISGGKKEWMGIKNRFFTSLVQPDKDALDSLDYYSYRQASDEVGKVMAAEAEEKKAKVAAPHNIMAVARTNQIDVGRSQKRLQFTIYSGPLLKDSLRAS